MKINNLGDICIAIGIMLMLSTLGINLTSISTFVTLFLVGLYFRGE